MSVSIMTEEGLVAVPTRGGGVQAWNFSQGFSLLNQQ